MTKLMIWAGGVVGVGLAVGSAARGAVVLVDDFKQATPGAYPFVLTGADEDGVTQDETIATVLGGVRHVEQTLIGVSDPSVDQTTVRVVPSGAGGNGVIDFDSSAGMSSGLVLEYGAFGEGAALGGALTPSSAFVITFTASDINATRPMTVNAYFGNSDGTSGGVVSGFVTTGGAYTLVMPVSESTAGTSQAALGHVDGLRFEFYGYEPVAGTYFPGLDFRIDSIQITNVADDTFILPEPVAAFPVLTFGAALMRRNRRG